MMAGQREPLGDIVKPSWWRCYYPTWNCLVLKSPKASVLADASLRAVFLPALIMSLFSAYLPPGSVFYTFAHFYSDHPSPAIPLQLSCLQPRGASQS